MQRKRETAGLVFLLSMRKHTQVCLVGLVCLVCLCTQSRATAGSHKEKLCARGACKLPTWSSLSLLLSSSSCSSSSGTN